MELSFILIVALAAFAPGDIDESPGCDDGDPETPCCPLEDPYYLISPEDWWACLDSLEAPLPPLQVGA